MKHICPCAYVFVQFSGLLGSPPSFSRPSRSDGQASSGGGTAGAAAVSFQEDQGGGCACHRWRCAHQHHCIDHIRDCSQRHDLIDNICFPNNIITMTTFDFINMQCQICSLQPTSSHCQHLCLRHLLCATNIITFTTCVSAFNFIARQVFGLPRCLL